MNYGYLFCLIAVVAWGVAVVPVRHARQDPFAGLAIGLAAGFLMVSAIWILAGRPHLPDLSGRAWFFLASGGLFRFPAATYCYYQGIQRAGILNATPLGRLKPVFVCLIVASLGWERPGIGAYAGATLAFVGAFLLFPRKLPVAPGQQPADRRRSGMLFAIFGSLSWAMGDIFLNEASGAAVELDPIGQTVIALAFGAAAYWAMLILTGHVSSLKRLSAKARGWYALHGVLSFGIGTLSMIAAFDTLPVSTVSIITSAWPLISVTIAYMLYKERVTLPQAIGLIITLASATAVLIW